MTNRFDSVYLNAKATTGTTTRVREPSPTSGICSLCIKECSNLCEISLSAFRGREVLYPEPEQFGWSTAASTKDYGLDWSHFNILVSLIGAEGIEPDPEKAIFTNVDVSTKIGGMRLNVPVFVAALGSTPVAKNNWRELAVGAAISGTAITVGENVVGMDPRSTFNNGKVNYSDDLSSRVKTYNEFWDGKNGGIMVQTNVEDQRANADIYALSHLEVTGIERKWGQGAKSIGGEVRITDLEEALRLKSRGYLVLPDPEDPTIQEAFHDKVFKSFERHSRVGMPNLRSFVEDVDWLRDQGAKVISLKTGAYRPSVVAFTMRAVSNAKIDYVTFDGAGGGTGMSPVSMMDDSGTPTVYLEAQVLKCAQILKKHGKHIPDIVMAGSFLNESQIFKAIAMSNFDGEPYVKAISMARAPITAVMKASYFAELSKEGKLPRLFAEKYGTSPDKFFITLSTLRERYGDRLQSIPWGAVGLYTYFNDRIAIGLKQLAAGVRKWKLNLIDRGDLVALSERAQKATGISTPEEVEADHLERLLLD